MRTLLLLCLACNPKGPKDPADTAEADLPTRWEGCPTAESAVGDPAWGGRLEVTEGALFCHWPDETSTLESALAEKGQARVIAGSYPFPTEAGSFALTVPACTRDAAGQVDATTGTGTGSVALAGTYMQLSLYQPSTAGQAIGVVLLHDLSGEATVPVNGQGPPSGWEGSVFGLYPASAEGIIGRGYGPCASAETWRVDTHRITFEGGEVELMLHIGDSAAGTEPFAFVSAKGQLDGVEFEQSDYFSLVYRPDHHHFGRNFAVLLPEPIGGACALRIEGLESESTTVGTVSLTDCELAAPSTRALQGHTLTTVGPS